MGIAFDAVSTGVNTSFTVSTVHTCAGSDRVAVAVVAGIRNSNVAWNFSSVTYDGIAMTQQAAVGSIPSNSRYMMVEIWTLLNPNTTAGATVLATAASVALLSSSIAVTTYTGVLAIGANNTASSTSGTAATVSVTTTAADAWLVGGVGAFEQAAATGTPGTSIVERFDFESAAGAANDDHNNMGGHRPCTTIASYPFAYTIPTSNDWYAAAVEITPAATVAELYGADLLIPTFGVSVL